MRGTSMARKQRSATAALQTGRKVDGGAQGSPHSQLYRDFALVSTDSILKIVVPPKAKRKGPRGGVQTPFPARLFDMLESCHEEGLSNIVSWQPHGRSFMVRKPAQFEAKILPRFFAQSKMSSFQRQLNLYGFVRQNSGPDRGCYYHELFLRGRPELPKIMVRTRVKGIGMGRTNKVEKEPDFYKMTPSLPNGNKTFQQPLSTVEPEEEEKEKEEAVPATLASPESSFMALSPMSQSSYHHEQQVCAQHQQSWQAPPPPPRVSPSVFVVTPMRESGGRPLFSTSMELNEMAASIADQSHPLHHHHHTYPHHAPHHHHHVPLLPYVPCSQAPPPPPPPPIHSNHIPPSHHHRHHCLPIRPISAHSLPRMPLNSEYNTESSFYLHPRNNSGHDEPWEVEDTALFEGLEFQVVDDDSLEQFESELITSDNGTSL